jgi:hypothetical protein
VDSARVDALLNELVHTRRAFEAASSVFDAAVSQIKWNKRNTIIQYFILMVLAVMIFLGGIYYLDDRQETCQVLNRSNSATLEALDENAIDIGIALATVSSASEDTFNQYLDLYHDENDHSGLTPREC